MAIWMPSTADQSFRNDPPSVLSMIGGCGAGKVQDRADCIEDLGGLESGPAEFGHRSGDLGGCKRRGPAEFLCPLGEFVEVAARCASDCTDLGHLIFESGEGPGGYCDRQRHGGRGGRYSHAYVLQSLPHLCTVDRR